MITQVTIQSTAQMEIYRNHNQYQQTHINLNNRWGVATPVEL